MFRLFTIAALSVAALCFLPESRAAEPAKPSCICEPGNCGCKPGQCPGGCPLYRVYAKPDCPERFGVNSLWLEWTGERYELGAVPLDTYPPFVSGLGFSDVLRVLADNPFAQKCPNGKCPAGSGPKAANSAGGCGSAPATVKGRVGFHPVRNAVQNRPRLFSGRRGCGG